MMSIPVVSMSRTAACTASSNISSRSAGPNSPRSYALTPANHQPGFPWEPTTAVGMRGSVIVSGLQRAGSRRAPDDTCETWIAPGILEPAREEDRAALDDVQTADVLGHVMDVGLGDQDRPAQLGDRRDTLAHGRDDRGREPLERLVEQEQLGVEREGPRDREHLPLAASQLRALAPRVPPEHREDAVGELDALRGGAPPPADADRKVGLAWMYPSTASTVSMARPSPRPGAPADDRVDDAPVGLDRGRRAVGEHAPLVEGDDPVGVAEDDVHVVLDLDNRLDADPPGGRDERLHDRRLVRRAHAGRRLVEQDYLRPQRERRCHVEELLVPLGQVPGLHVTLPAQTEQLGDLERALSNRAVGGEGREEAAAVPETRDHRRLERLEHREVRKDLDELEGPCDPQAGQAGGSDPAHVAVPEGDGAGGGAENAGEDVDERGLARPVRPDDRDELTGADGEAHAVERAELAVELPEPLGAEDHGDEASTGGRLAQNPASPPGATMTIAARIAPKISRQNGTTDITQS